MPKLSLLLSLPLLAMTLGCGEDDGPARYDVSGMITFDGDTVDTGRVMFTPDASKGNKGQAVHANIVGGSYSTAENSNGKGVIGGPHIVRVTGYDGQTDLENELPFGNFLFPEYEMNVDLPAANSGNGEPEFLDIEVPKS